MAYNRASLKMYANGGDKLLEKGPAYGYFPKPSKTWLIVKEGKMDEAKRIFDGTGVQFLRRHETPGQLAVAKGSNRATLTTTTKNQRMDPQRRKLAKIAVTEPQVAFSACILNRVTFFTN